MGLHRDHNDAPSFFDISYEEEKVDKNHKKYIRRMLEERLERKRLKAELEDELDGEFDWDEFDR